MGLFKQEYWNRLPFPSPGDLPDPATKPPSPVSPALAGRFFTTEPPRKPRFLFTQLFFFYSQVPQATTNSRITCKLLAGVGEPCGSQGTLWFARNASKRNISFPKTKLHPVTLSVNPQLNLGGQIEFSRQVDGQEPYLPVGFWVLHELQSFLDLRFHLVNMRTGVHRPRVRRVNG